MCNEELAILIKQGKSELYGELWENTKALMYKFARRFYYGNAERCASAGVEFEDIIQSCFFVLTDMVKAYDEEKGFKFTTYFHFLFKNRMKALINGGIEGNRSAAYKNLLNSCKSLDEPIKGIKSDSDELALIDTVEDEKAEKPLEQIEYKADFEQLHDEVEKAIARLPQLQGEAIRKKYLKDENASVLNEQERKNAKKALTALRKDNDLRTFGIEYLGLNLYSATGLQAWKNTQCSSVERLVEKAEEIREYAQKRPHDEKC